MLSDSFKKHLAAFGAVEERTIWIVADWEKRGIREREAAMRHGMAITDEDRGDGHHWTPYTPGFNCFFTHREALTAVQKDFERQRERLLSEVKRLTKAVSSAHHDAFHCSVCSCSHPSDPKLLGMPRHCICVDVVPHEFVPRKDWA